VKVISNYTGRIKSHRKQFTSCSKTKKVYKELKKSITHLSYISQSVLQFQSKERHFWYRYTRIRKLKTLRGKSWN